MADACDYLLQALRGEGLSPQEVQEAGASRASQDAFAEKVARLAAEGRLAYPRGAAYAEPFDMLFAALREEPLVWARHPRAADLPLCAATSTSATAAMRAKFWAAPGGELLSSACAYARADQISSHCNEEARLASWGSSWSSPLDEWRHAPSARRAAQRALMTALGQKAGLRAKDLREACWELSQQRPPIFREATNFRPTTAAAIYRLFAAKAVLDPCAGWGDRALAAAAVGACYVGVDPSLRLHGGYESLRRACAAHGPALLTFRPLPFENYSAELCEQDFRGLGALGPDLVLFSPPYYDWEIYSSEPGQSYQGQSWEAWQDGWLLPVAEKAWGLLRPGGFFAAYVNNVRGVSFGGFFRHMARVAGGRPTRIDCRRGSKRPLPLWVWMKPASL